MNEAAKSCNEWIPFEDCWGQKANVLPKNMEYVWIVIEIDKNLHPEVILPEVILAKVYNIYNSIGEFTSREYYTGTGIKPIRLIAWMPVSKPDYVVK